jgi:hypothetical protein
VANNPVETWVLRNCLADSILGKHLMFLTEGDLLIRVLYNLKELHLTGLSDSTQIILRVMTATIATTIKIGGASSAQCASMISESPLSLWFCVLVEVVFTKPL